MYVYIIEGWAGIKYYEQFIKCSGTTKNKKCIIYFFLMLFGIQVASSYIFNHNTLPLFYYFVYCIHFT